jgi:hypothetical protein
MYFRLVSETNVDPQSMRAAVASWRRCMSQVASGIALAGLIAVAPGHAQEQARYNTFEITPFAGVMGGGDFEDPLDDSERSVKSDTNFGLFLDIADEGWRHYELFYSKLGSEVDGGAGAFDMDVEYLQIGGIVSHPDAQRLIPFFGATLGAARFSPDLSGLDDETNLAFSVGGGLRVPLADHIAIRFDARVFLTVLDSDSQVFCVSAPPSASCRIRAKSDTFVQYAGSLGVTIGF